jgi:hypothetical protein
VDLELFNGRVQFQGTGYNRKSTDALVQAPFAASVGGGSRYVNIGSVSNKGLEGLFVGRVIDRSAVSFDVTLNGSVTNNKLESVGPDAPPGYYYNSGFVGARHKVGYPLFGGWQLPILSVDDKNGDHIIVASEVVVGDTETYIGPTSPTKQATVSGNLGLWRDLVRASVLFDWRGGYMRNDYTSWVGCALSADCRASVDRTAPFSEQAAIIAYTKANTNAGYWADGAFTRLREVSVSVRAPSKFLQASRASAGSLTLSGRNLKLWSKWPGGDPEVNGATGNDLTYTFPTPPMPRYYIVRLNLSY